MTDNLEEKPKAWNILGIEFAPLRIPLERRMQTTTVAFFFSTLIFAMFAIIPLFSYMLIFSRYWYIPTLWATWVFYDRHTPYQGGRKWHALRNSKIWHYYRDYFPIKLVKTHDLPPEGNYIFAVYPHGIVSASTFLNFQSNATKFDELFPGIDSHIVILNANFRIPFAKDLFLACGAIAASECSLINCLRSKPGSSCVLMPGGAGEALRSLPGNCNILLKNRRGFVRIALKTGASIVPVFSFGENEIFDQVTGKWILWIQDKLRIILGLSPCILKGRGFFQYSFGMLPHRKPIVTVVGQPISVPKVESPSKELVAEYHQKYTDSLLSLFNDYKEKYHPRGSEVELIIE